jgi:hypothetical protein
MTLSLKKRRKDRSTRYITENKGDKTINMPAHKVWDII